MSKSKTQNCDCSYCVNNLGNRVTELIPHFPIEEISRIILTESGFKGNWFSVKKHAEFYGLDFTRESKKSDVTVLYEEQPSHPINSNGNTALDDLAELSLARFGLSMQDQIGIVTYLQEKLLCLSIQQMAIIHAQQQCYLEGDSDLEPSRTATGNLRSLLTLADRFTAISLNVNQQQAIRIVEAIAGVDSQSALPVEIAPVRSENEVSE